MDNIQRHILYIEDHDDTRELVTLVLTNSNYRVTTASSSKEALKLAREENFDLYILDSRLPDGSGIELCKRLRKLDHGTPIMFLSAAAYDTDKQDAMNNGAQRYLVKPDDIQVLSQEVNALILGLANEGDQSRPLARNRSLSSGSTDDRVSEEHGSTKIMAL